MCLTEYDEARTFAEQRSEGIAEGMAKGIAKGRTEGIAEGMIKGRAEGKLLLLIGLVEKGFLTLEQAAKELNVTIEEFKEKASKLAITQ